jgi:predicted nucleic acid-binding protein
MSRRAVIRRAFIDSSAYFALFDRQDQRHDEARAIQQRLIRDRSRLFTTNLVVVETHALLLTRLSHAIATAFTFDHHFAQYGLPILSADQS